MGRLGSVGREGGTERGGTTERKGVIGGKYMQEDKEECGEGRREKKEA